MYKLNVDFFINVVVFNNRKASERTVCSKNVLGFLVWRL